MMSVLVWEGLDVAVEEDKTGTKIDAKAKALFVFNVDDDHASIVKAATSAKEAWEALRDMHQAKSFARRVYLKRELNNLRLKDSERLEGLFGRARTLGSDLKGCRVEDDIEKKKIYEQLIDEDVVLAILTSLPPAYNGLVQALTAFDYEGDLQHLFGKLSAVEATLTTSRNKEEGEVQAFMTYAGGRNSRRAPSGSREDIECFYCGKRGHLKAHCRKRIKDNERPTEGRVIAL